MAGNYFSQPFLHLSEQYFTSFHTFSHFFRHVNALPQRAHIGSLMSFFTAEFAPIKTTNSQRER
jgi:hypothetical protein